MRSHASGGGSYAPKHVCAETGLYHTQRREYHCSLARFIERDPGGCIDGMSLYEYVG
jgi:RHS repeat-associated protein